MIAYLDNSATTRPTDGVVDEMTLAMREGYFNPSSLYAPAISAERAMRACREAIASAISADAANVYFTSGGTEANNLAILGLMGALRVPGRAIAFADEHPSCLEPIAALQKAGHRVTVVGVDGAGQPDWAALDEALHDPPDLVTCIQVNNETGAMPDLARLIQTVRSAAPGARVHIDGVQGFLRVPIDARKIDLYTLSAHKIHGPKGIGALYVAPGVRLTPRQLGGGQEGALRSGTENTPGITGLRRAIEEMRSIPDLHARLMDKKARMARLFLDAAPGALVNGPEVSAGAPHILNMSFPGVGGEVLLHALEGDGVYASTGAACSSKKRKVSAVLTAMGQTPERAGCALRFSLSPHTSDSEIEYAADVLRRQCAVLRRYGRR